MEGEGEIHSADLGQMRGREERGEEKGERAEVQARSGLE